ncbi:PAS domain S-box protein [Flavobacterium frigoris]|uniref:histidine kinase n=1 Tax=Flavobacterium frigoris (strain PS1) TaxID=1086011 RepID=H7FQW0_FLAFP|nr:PAS domain S-box protein [Flavobacterium frigoris]EIA09097.1 two-component sensor histidine kinase [Flavobacterium frigoris PS1]
METSAFIQNKTDEINFTKNKNEFNSILLFLSEVCEVPYVYLTIKGVNNKTKDYRIGFDNSVSDDVLSMLDTVTLQNKSSVFSSDNKVSKIKLALLNNSESHFAFFAGFPILNQNGSVVGSLSLMNLVPHKITALQNKVIAQSIINIQSIINLMDQNTELQNNINDKTIQFEIHNANSIEITYKLDDNGIITEVSKKWETILGHKTQTIIGTNFTEFIHPEDLKICTQAVKNLIEHKTRKEELTYRIKHLSGNFVWHSAILTIVNTKNGFYFVGNCRDITEHIESKLRLEEQKKFYITILDSLPTAVAVFDENRKYLYLNPTSIKNEELRNFIIGKDDFEYAVHTGRSSSFAELRRKQFLEALDSKELIEWQDEITNANGSIITNKRKYNPVFREDGTLEMMVGFGTDITQSVKIQKEILESKQLLQRILENVAVGILVQGPDSEIIENNQAACEMLGLSQDQLLGKTSFDSHWKVIHSDGTDFRAEEHPVPKAIKELKRIEGVVMGVFRPIQNDFVWLLVDAIPVFNDNNTLLYVICSFNNITNQKNAENELKISNERFLYSNKASSDVIWDWDLASQKVFYGDGYYEHFGFELNNTINNLGNHSHLVHPLDRDKTYASISAAILSKSDSWEYEYRHLKSDNSYAIVKDTAYIVRNEQGNAIRIIGAMKNITDKRKLEYELQQSEEQFKGAFNHSAAGMALINTEGYYIEVNERLIEILGYTSAEMKSLKLNSLVHKFDLKQLLIFKEKLDSEKISKFNIEIRFIHKNKTWIWTHLSVSIIKNSANKYYISQFIDITQRKKIEAENKLLLDENNRNKQIQLDEAKNLYRLLANNTVDLVCLHDLESFFEYVSPSVKKLVGYQPEELIGKAPRDFVHPEDLERFQESMRTNDFWKNKISKNENYRFKHADGGYIWLQTTTILLEKNGTAVGFQTNGRDVTKELEAKQIIEKALIKERKLNELRTNLVSTISHEFRTPMTTIRTSAELIKMYLKGQNIENELRVQKRVDVITHEIDRIVELMNAVLTISKEDSGKTSYSPTVLDLKALCKEVIEEDYMETENNMNVAMICTGNNFLVFADKNLMHYSISNILNNAFKYSKNSKNVTLNIISTESDCKIEVIDYGIGIPKKDQDKLFNTFFRASNTDGIQGTGLGLHIVKNFVEKNNGTVTLESEIGIGTMVTMQFQLHKLVGNE